LTVLAVAVLATGVAQPAAAAPSDQPGGTSAVLDSRALDQLQQRAAEVQTGLQEQQAEVAAAREEQARAEEAVAAAEAVVSDAEGELAVHQREVASYAAAVYRDGGAVTPLTVLLSGGDPGEVVSALSFLDVVDAHAARVIGAAEVQRQAALGEQQRAEAALAVARQEAEAVAAKVAELEAQVAAIDGELLDPAVYAQPAKVAELGRRQADLRTALERAEADLLALYDTA
jgi:hypothetical protein